MVHASYIIVAETVIIVRNTESSPTFFTNVFNTSKKIIKPNDVYIIKITIFTFTTGSLYCSMKYQRKFLV